MGALEAIGFYTLSDKRAYDASSTSQMKRGEIIINEYCNFKCPYCRGLSPAVFGNRRIRHSTYREVTQAIDYWCSGDAGPIENIRFSGGEPTLHPNIIEIAWYAKTKGIKRIAISSNGSSEPVLYRALVAAGVNDFSISLDACCATVGDRMAGNVPGSFDRVVENIKMLSELTYVTVGVVMTPDNIDGLIQTIIFADSLGVSDIRIISAAQWDQPLPGLAAVPADILKRHPILAYRVDHFMRGINVRGIGPSDARRCGLVLDDSVIAGLDHYPCVIYMREGGQPIGKVGPEMRQERLNWFKSHNCHNDPICSKNCLDVCVDYNNMFRYYHYKPWEN